MTREHADMLVEALRDQGFVCQMRSIGFQLRVGPVTENEISVCGFPMTEEYEIVVRGLIVTGGVNR